MPKGNKTHSGSKKRFKLTAGGKLLRRRAGKNHLRSKKSAGAKRVGNTPASVTGSIKKNIKRALGV